MLNFLFDLQPYELQDNFTMCFLLMTLVTKPWLVEANCTIQAPSVLMTIGQIHIGNDAKTRIILSAKIEAEGIVLALTAGIINFV